MEQLSVTLTVFFEKPFWVGIIEKMENQKLTACKITFGAEPKDFELADFLLKNAFRFSFSPPVKTSVKKAAKNPKRIKRDIGKQVQNTGIGTKSQQALQLQREEKKTERQFLCRQKKEKEKKQQFEKKQQKKKARHKGK